MELQPLLSDAAASTLSLASLPPDIIRLTLRLNGQPMEKLRLIAPSWNEFVLEYLADRRNHPPLESISFYSMGHAMKAAMIANWLPEHDDHFKRLFPDWRRADESPRDDGISSPYLHMRTIKREKWYLFLFFFIMTINMIRFSLLWLLTYPVFIGGFLAWRLLLIHPKVLANCRILKRIFTRCSGIRKLEVKLEIGATLDTVMSTLGDVPIGELIIHKKKCDREFRQQIVKMVRAHKIGKVVIAVNVFKDFNLRKFLLKVTEHTHEVIILEQFEKEYNKIFGRTRRFWEKTARDMSDDSFAIQVLNGESYFNVGNSYMMQLRITA